MSDDEIRISGPKIVIDAHDELDCSGGRAGLRLADGARLVGSKVELLGSGARVTLDGDASVLGGSVRLGSGSGAQREVQDPTHDDARPHRLAFSFFVGEGREHTSRAALVVEDRGGRVLARLEAPEAIERAHGHLTWELDPTRFDVPVLVAVIDDRRAHHRVAGPADLRQLTGAMVAGDLASEHRLRGTHPHRRRVRREDPTPAIDPRMDEDARAVKQHRAMEEDVALHDILTHLR